MLLHIVLRTALPKVRTTALTVLPTAQPAAHSAALSAAPSASLLDVLT